jgi:hypothetical protein
MGTAYKAATVSLRPCGSAVCFVLWPSHVSCVSTTGTPPRKKLLPVRTRHCSSKSIQYDNFLRVCVKPSDKKSVRTVLLWQGDFELILGCCASCGVMECISDAAAVVLHVSACFCVLMGPVRASCDKKECKNSLNHCSLAKGIPAYCGPYCVVSHDAIQQHTCTCFLKVSAC